MKALSLTPLIAILLTAGALTADAQPGQQQVRTDGIRIIRKTNANKTMAEQTRSAMDQGDDEQGQSEQVLRPLTELRREVKNKIKVNDHERDGFRQLLGDRKVNIARLLSSYSCSSSVVIDISDPRCQENPDLFVVSHYSFRYKEHGENEWTDISLNEDELSAGNKWHTSGILADLGTAADFSKLDETSGEVAAVWNYESARSLKERYQQKEDLEKGVVLGNLTLINKLKIELEHTYILRTTSYRLEGGYSGYIPGYGWHNTDSLFVIKVLELKPDRTATIAWKRISQRVAPVLKDKEPKGEK